MKNSFLLLLIFFYWNPCFTQTVVSTNLSACDKSSDPTYLHDMRLISKEIINDTLVLKIGVVRQCTYSPGSLLELKGDSLILTLTDVSELFTACECCFEIEIKVNGIPDTNFRLYEYFTASTFTNKIYEEHLEAREIRMYENKYVFPTINEMERHTEYNKLTSDSLKIGLWNFYFEDGAKIKLKVFF